MNTSEIYADLNGQVYEIKISRADKMNALTDAMYGSLVEHLKYADSNAGIKVILLRSDNQHFTAGNDLKDFVENDFNDESNVIEFLITIATLKKPIVCAVAGATVGIGTTMLLHYDLVFAAKDTQFSMPFIKLGLTPEGGSSVLLEKRCGSAKANDWLLTGRTFLTEEAEAAGLINASFADLESTWNGAKKAAKSLTHSSLEALIATKKLLKGDQVESVISCMKKEAVVFQQRLESDETKAALDAFLKN